MSAPLFIDSLDDEPLMDGNASFSGGMVSNAPAARLNENQAALIQNFDINSLGELTTRRGTKRLGSSTVGASVTAGAPYDGGTNITAVGLLKTSALNYLLAVNNRYLWKWNGTAWSIANTTWHAGGDGTRMVQGIDKVYLIDGVGHLFSWNGTTLTDLGGGGASEPPTAAKCICWHTSRLVLAGMTALPDTVAFSGIIDDTLWSTTTQTLRVGGGEGDAIVGLCPWIDYNLIVIKRNSLWVIHCDPTQDVENFEIKCIHPSIGSIYPNTFVQVGSDVIGLTNSGVRSMRQTFAATQTQNEVGPSISFPVDDIVTQALTTVNAVATFRAGKYILSIGMPDTFLGVGSDQRITMVYDSLLNCWVGYWTGWNATGFTPYYDSSGNVRLAFGVNDGTVREWLDYMKPSDLFPGGGANTGFQDAATTDYEAKVKTRSFTFGDEDNPKSGLNYDIRYGGTNTLIDLIGSLDSGESGAWAETTINGIVKPNLHKALDLQAYGQFRELQITATSGGGRCCIRSIKARAFADSVVLQTA